MLERGSRGDYFCPFSTNVMLVPRAAENVEGNNDISQSSLFLLY